MQDGQVNYTFANVDSVPAPLRGKSFTGGKLAINKELVEVFRFAEIIDGKTVSARVAGNPELEAAAAEIKAGIANENAAARQAFEVAVAAYELASKKYATAAAAYDRQASNYSKSAAGSAAKAAILGGAPTSMHGTLMTSEQFDALAELLRLRAGPAAEAVRLVMTQGISVADAARAVGMEYRLAWRAVQRAQDGLTLIKKVNESS